MPMAICDYLWQAEAGLKSAPRVLIGRYTNPCAKRSSG